MCPSVCPSVCDVCALWSQGRMDPGYLCMLGYMDVFAKYLLTTPHPDRRMGWCRNFWWKRECMEKLVIVAISLNLLTQSLDRKHVTALLLFNGLCWRVFFSDLGRKRIISEERFVLELPTSRAMLATTRPCCLAFTIVRTVAEFPVNDATLHAYPTERRRRRRLYLWLGWWWDHDASKIAASVWRRLPAASTRHRASTTNWCQRRRDMPEEVVAVCRNEKWRTSDWLIVTSHRGNGNWHPPYPRNNF